MLSEAAIGIATLTTIISTGALALYNIYPKGQGAPPHKKPSSSNNRPCCFLALRQTQGDFDSFLLVGRRP